MNIQIKIHAIIKPRKCVLNTSEIHGKSNQNQNPKAPKDGQGGQNEPRGVPEASRRRPRLSKKHPGGAKVDLVAVYKSKQEPKCVLEASRASKMSPEPSQRRPGAVRVPIPVYMHRQLYLYLYGFGKKLFKAHSNPKVVNNCTTKKPRGRMIPKKPRKAHGGIEKTPRSRAKSRAWPKH